jgi:hypothetical protein
MAVAPVVVRAPPVALPVVRVPPVLAAPRAEEALLREQAPLVVVRASVAAAGEAAVPLEVAAARLASASVPGSAAA